MSPTPPDAAVIIVIEVFLLKVFGVLCSAVRCVRSVKDIRSKNMIPLSISIKGQYAPKR